jgi:hypothetical protein
LVPDGTACSDGRTCSTAVPPPILAGCTMRPADGLPCTKDIDCTAAGAMSCSGPGPDGGTASGGPADGRCCPVGTACDFTSDPDAGYSLGRCVANNGAANAATSRDFCRAGACAVDDASACP